MGQDFAQEKEWNFKTSLDWHLADDPGHRDVMDCYRTLLHLYKERPVLYNDTSYKSFEWIESGDVARSIFAFIRRNPWNYNDALIFVCNMTPMGYSNYGVGAPVSGKYKRIFSTYPDGSLMEVEAEEALCNGRPYKLSFTLRPFEAIILEVPFHESTEQEKESEKKEKTRVKKEHKAVKTDVSHIPTDEIPEELAEKKPAKKRTCKKKS
ncbi:MAG: alpha amylase C-terminal domain-containing protein, partial [Candidatus Coproplasma sp.]